MATIDEFIKSLEDEFGVRGKGKAFEIFCKWYFKTDPHWSKIVDQIWLWDEFPKKWQSQDLGTDLVFKDYDGALWAIQAKCYQEHAVTTKSDLNSFLADTSREEITRRVWVQTTNKMHSNAVKTLEGQEKPVTVINLNDLREAQIDYPSNLSEISKASIKAKPNPYRHQLEAIEAVVNGFSNQERGQLIMACGSGKTFTTLWIRERLNAQTTLYLVPSLNLLSQTMREWAWAGRDNFKILNVCSDTTVGSRTNDQGDMLLNEAPFPVTSDVKQIQKFLKTSGNKVVFCTYQSSMLISEAQRDPSVPSFDLAISDEAHRCAGKMDRDYSNILSEKKISAQKRLFTTATPRYFGKSTRDEANSKDIQIIGMDDEKVFGKVFHKLSFGEAIKRDILSDYQIAVIGVDEPSIKKWIDGEELISTNSADTFDAKSLAVQLSFLKAIKDYNLKRVITFHNRVDKAKNFASQVQKTIELIPKEIAPSENFSAEFVAGYMPTSRRKEQIAKLKSLSEFDWAFLSNAQCLSEGVDVPALDGIAFIDPRQSQVQIIQAVGRAIRKSGKVSSNQKGTIIVPIFLDATDDADISFNKSKFKTVWNVVKALRAHDDALAMSLDEHRIQIAKKGKVASRFLDDKLSFSLPANYDLKFVDALKTIIVSSSTATWYHCFGLLQKYRQREGHCIVPIEHQEDGFNLGSWVRAQRTNKRHARLSNDKVEKLNSIGFVWEPNQLRWQDTWYRGFLKFKKFVTREGHSEIELTYREENFALGNWVARQRTNRHNLSPKRRKLLDNLGFIWNVHGDRWGAGFSALCKFKKEYGHTNVPLNWNYQGVELGKWVVRQLASEKTMPIKRYDLLNEINFFPVKHPKTAPPTSSAEVKKPDWNDYYLALLMFKNREGHTKVPFKHKEGTLHLGGWVFAQRAERKVMSESRKVLLDEIEFEWTKKPTLNKQKPSWKKRFNL